MISIKNECLTSIVFHWMILHYSNTAIYQGRVSPNEVLNELSILAKLDIDDAQVKVAVAKAVVDARAFLAESIKDGTPLYD